MELHLISDPYKAEQERRRVNTARKNHGLIKVPFNHAALDQITHEVMSLTGAGLDAQSKGRGLTKKEFAEASTALINPHPKAVSVFGVQENEDEDDEDTESTIVTSPGKERVSKPTSTAGGARKDAANEAFQRAMKLAGRKAGKWAYGLVIHHERANGSFVPKTTAAKLAAEVVKDGGTWADLLERAKVVTA